MHPIITIFTPSYNRAYTLPRLYESLLAQTCKDFEWIIIDDGSTDNTEEVCSKFESNDFPIQYIKTQNSGKYKAINLATKIARGRWFFCVDSDDWLPTNAIQLILEAEGRIRDKDKCGLLAGMKHFGNGDRVGGNLNNFTDVECTNYEFRYSMKVKGDLAELIRVDVLKENLFPDFGEEKFCPEALLFNRLGKKYTTHYFNKNIYFCEYLPDGLSANTVLVRQKNPKATILCYAEQARCNVPFSVKVKSYINFWRFFLCLSTKEDLDKYQISWWGYLCYPVGWMMYISDSLKYPAK